VVSFASPSVALVRRSAPWIRSDGHAPAGVATQAKLTLEADHSMGADQTSPDEITKTTVSARECGDRDVLANSRPA
jgi:hypothetical protein